MRGETTQLPSHGGNLVQVHERKNHGIEHGQHFHHRNDADSATIFPKGGISMPVEMILHLPVCSKIPEKTLWRTMPQRKRC